MLQEVIKDCWRDIADIIVERFWIRHDRKIDQMDVGVDQTRHYPAAVGLNLLTPREGSLRHGTDRVPGYADIPGSREFLVSIENARATDDDIMKEPLCF